MSAADRLAILELPARYSRAWDAADAGAYAALFSEDAVFELYRGGVEQPSVRLEGREAIRAWAEERHAARPAGQQPRAHAGGTIIDELGAESASGRSMLLQTIVSAGDDAPRPAVSGVYREEWRRTPEGWRFASRRLRLDGP